VQQTTTDWVNTSQYTTWQLWMFGIGCALWAVDYVGVLIGLKREKFLEIPAAAVVANVAWEFVWGFFFVNSLGMLFTWGYRAWFFLDCFIVYHLMKVGAKQVRTPELKKYWVPVCAFGILAWALAIYFWVKMGYDTGVGATSGYVLNVLMSFLYITLLLNQPIQYFSTMVAWSKMLGTGILTVWNTTLPEINPFVITLGVVTFVLDMTYIVLVHRRKAEARAKSVGSAKLQTAAA
jgi:hypothetical protein